MTPQFIYYAPPVTTPLGNEFITTWDTTLGDGDGTVTIPVDTGNFTYNYEVDWGDGTTDTNVTGNAFHDYSGTTGQGVKNIRISGSFPSILCESAKDNLKIIDVVQWGNIVWESFSNSFRNCQNLDVTATDAPDLSLGPEFNSAFRNSLLTNANFNNWDVSQIDTFTACFRDSDIRSGLANWKTPLATAMVAMFRGANNYNEDLSNWCVPLIPSQPNNFDAGATSWSLPRPVWGTCP